MALGTWDDIVAVRQVYGDDALRALLVDPPPGVFDPRSWHYWHAVFGIDPVPSLPRRFEGQRPDDDDRTPTPGRRPSTPLIRGGTPLRSSPDTLAVEIDGVVLSFFGALNLGSVGVPEVAVENDVPVASLLDLAATKVKAVVDRAEAKDYLDIAALLAAGISLADALGAAKAVFGPRFNEALALKALTFFEEGDLPSLPKSVQRRLIEAVTGVRQVPHFERRSNGLFPDEIERRLAMV